MKGLIGDITIAEKLNSMAQQIDQRLYLIAYYCPKIMTDKNIEYTFWCGVTNAYGLFCDCANFHIKMKKNLFKIFVDNGLMLNDDYEIIRTFFYNISALRSYFCHNCSNEFYYSRNHIITINQLIFKQFGLMTNKPEGLSKITEKRQWELLLFWLDNNMNEYVNILIKTLNNLAKFEHKFKVVEEWLSVIAQSHFEDKELLNNVLMDLYSFEIKNFSLKVNISSYNIINEWKQILVNKGFCINDVMEIIEQIQSPALPMITIKNALQKYNLSLTI